MRGTRKTPEQFLSAAKGKANVLCHIELAVNESVGVGNCSGLGASQATSAAVLFGSVHPFGGFCLIVMECGRHIN